MGRAPDAQGVVIRSVVPSGPAARAGLRPGDVIVDVEGIGVLEPGTVLSTIVESKKLYVALTVEREGRLHFIALRRVVDGSG